MLLRAAALPDDADAGGAAAHRGLPSPAPSARGVHGTGRRAILTTVWLLPVLAVAVVGGLAAVSLGSVAGRMTVALVALAAGVLVLGAAGRRRAAAARGRRPGDRRSPVAGDAGYTH